MLARLSAREEMRAGAPEAPGEARRGMLPLRAFCVLRHRSDPAAPAAGPSASQAVAHPWEAACSHCVPKGLRGNPSASLPFLFRGWVARPTAAHA